MQGKNFDDGLRMVECTKCLSWVHTACSGIKDDADPPDGRLINIIMAFVSYSLDL